MLECETFRDVRDSSYEEYTSAVSKKDIDQMSQTLRGLTKAEAARVVAAAIYDDVGGGRVWFRGRALPSGATHNVVAELGDPRAERTVVFMAHHDTTIEAEDHVIVFVTNKRTIPQVEKLFQVGYGFL